MSRWHRRTRRDANHNEIVAALRQIGATVVDLAAVGGGCPDLLVGYRGRNVLLEIKNPNHKRKSGSTNPTTGQKQADFRAAWRGQSAVCDSVQSAIAVVTVASTDPVQIGTAAKL